MLEKLIPFLVAIALGFAIGLERERRHFKHRSMGVRTFILLGLLGAMAGFQDNPLLSVAMMLFAATSIIIGYIRTTALDSHSKSVDFGLTTEIAGGATFVLGYLAHLDPLLSAILGLVVFIVLLSRAPLHKFSTEKVKSNEIQAAVILFVLVVGVLPLLPDQALDPWGLLNIKKFVMIITVIAAVQFGSYIAIRIFSEAVGLPLSGILGGFVSSTAVLLTLPDTIRADRRAIYPAISAALFASASTFVFLLFVVGVLSTELFWTIFPVLFVPIILGSSIAFVMARRADGDGSIPILKNPISFLSAVKLGLSLSGVIVLIGVIQRFLGPAGTQIASFVAGLAELHGVSVSATLLYLKGTLTGSDAKNSILLAALGSMLSKLVIVWVWDRGRYAVYTSLALVLMIVSMGAVWWLF